MLYRLEYTSCIYPYRALSPLLSGLSIYEQIHARFFFAMGNSDYSLPRDASIHLDIKMATRTSARAQATADFLGVPWKFAAKQTYDKETNPNGLISLALAENVC